MSARDVARRVLQRVAAQDAFVSLALGAELDRAGLDARDRRLATELVYGVCRHRPRIDRALAAVCARGLDKLKPPVITLLRVAAYQLIFLDRVPAHAAVSDAVTAARYLGGARMAGFANAVLRRLARDGEPALPPREHTLAYIEAACSLPGWLVQRLASELGAREQDELLAAAFALGQPAPLSIRVQRRRISPSALGERLRADHPGIEITPSAHCPDALMLSGLGDPERSPSFAEGLWTVQDIGAQLVTRLLDFDPRLDPRPGTGDRTDGADLAKLANLADAATPPRFCILDACAGLGGKSTHLAELYGDVADIHAADISARKLELLASAAARLGVTVRARACDLTMPGDALAPAYDAILLDAPCSGLGVIRRHPEALLRMQTNHQAHITRMAELQRALLDAMAARVAPGGVLVYSVCTFTSEEGQAQIDAFLARHPEFSLAALSRSAAADAVPWAVLCPAPGIMRTWPHRHGADAFFAARLVRVAGADDPR